MNIFFVLAALIAVSFCQTSTNPPGTPFFSPSNVHQLSLNSTLSSVLNSTDFYNVWVPSTVGRIQYTLTTDPTCSQGLQAFINTLLPFGDSSYGYSCSSSGYAYQGLCNFYDFSIFAPPGTSKNVVLSAPTNFRPGSTHYISVTTASANTGSCSYSIQAEVLFECPESLVPLYDATLKCTDFTSLSNGDSITGLMDGNELRNVYRLAFPQNVSRVSVFAESNATFSLYLTAGMAGVFPAWSDYGTSYPTRNISSLTYYFQLNFSYPLWNVPIYAVFQPSSYTSNFTIKTSWSYCGSFYGGLGSEDPWSPDCSQPVVYNNLPVLDATPTSYLFNLPPYNTSLDAVYPSQLAYFEIPQHTASSFNLSCTSNSTSDVWIGLSRGSYASCVYNTGGFNCDGTAYSLLSHDLYNGGQWSVSICHSASTHVAVTLRTGNLPNPSPSPSSSPLPSSTLSPSPIASTPASPSPVPSEASPIPSATPSGQPASTASSSPSSPGEESASLALYPTIVLIAAILIHL